MGGGDFLAFPPPGTSCNAFNLLDFRRLVKGGFSEFLSFGRSAAVSGDSPRLYQLLQPPSTPTDDFAGDVTSPSRTRREPRLGRAPEDTEPPRVVLAGVPVGVGDGVRTRDLRNHNPAL